MPDSAVAKQAEKLCLAMRPSMLVNHSFRTYLWAAVLASQEGIRYDEEVVYVSSLLHDYGLADGHDDGSGCFTLIGARAARELGHRSGWTAERAERAAEAITLHMNLRVPRSCVEARLVTLATQLDVIGSSYWRVHPKTVEAVLNHYPRGDLKKGMVTRFREQARHNPGTRAHFYYRYLGLPLLIRASPFAE